MSPSPSLVCPAVLMVCSRRRLIVTWRAGTVVG
jgi:hypothetical protein